MVFPSNVASVVIDGHEYTPNSEGVVESATASHIPHLRLVGATDYNPASGLRPLAPEERVSVVLDENALLRARIRELEAQARLRTPSEGITDTSGAATGMLVPDAGATASGGVPGGATSTAAPQGQSGDNLDKTGDGLKEALAQAPNFDDPNVTRDQIVLWLASVGTSVPGNIARDKAVAIAKDRVAGLNEEADTLAGEARSEANGTATEPKV